MAQTRLLGRVNPQPKIACDCQPLPGSLCCANEETLAQPFVQSSPKRACWHESQSSLKYRIVGKLVAVRVQALHQTSLRSETNSLSHRPAMAGPDCQRCPMFVVHVGLWIAGHCVRHCYPLDDINGIIVLRRTWQRVLHVIPNVQQRPKSNENPKHAATTMTLLKFSFN